MRIVISGTPGSGKSTAARAVARALNLPHYSMGDLQRRYAAARGITIGELMRLEESDPTIDREIDALQTKIGKTEAAFIIDGRFSAHFIPQALKVFLDASPAVRAERVWSARRADEHAANARALLAKLDERDASDDKRGRALYGISYRDPKLYDHVLDTSTLTPEAVVAQIIAWAREQPEG